MRNILRPRSFQMASKKVIPQQNRSFAFCSCELSLLLLLFAASCHRNIHSLDGAKFSIQLEE